MSISLYWNAGDPPSIGWWPASTFKNYHMLRWWNGEYWSRPVLSCCNAEQAAKQAVRETMDQGPILWTERWWL